MRIHGIYRKRLEVQFWLNFTTCSSGETVQVHRRMGALAGIAEVYVRLQHLKPFLSEKSEALNLFKKDSTCSHRVGGNRKR